MKEITVEQDRADSKLTPFNGQQVFTRGFWLKKQRQVEAQLTKYVQTTGQSACVVEATYGSAKYDYSSLENEYPREYTIRPLSQIVSIEGSSIKVIAWYKPNRSKFYDFLEEGLLEKSVQRIRKRKAKEIEVNPDSEEAIKMVNKVLEDEKNGKGNGYSATGE